MNAVVRGRVMAWIILKRFNVLARSSKVFLVLTSGRKNALS